MTFLRSSIGTKLLVAITGLMLLGFVVAHLLGNLTIFLGPDGINAYGVKIRHLGALLWIARLVLLAAVVVHIALSIRLAIENRRARPSGYAMVRPMQSTAASRSMAVSGVMILAFVLYHLAHFTFRWTHPEISHSIDAMGRHDIYSMVVLSFQQPLVSGFYLLAMALLCAHLSHGIASTCQTLGLNDERTIPMVRRIGSATAILIFLGYASIPSSVMLGLLK